MKLTLVLMLFAASAYAVPQALSVYEPNGDQSSEKQTENVVLREDGSFTLRFADVDGNVVLEEGILMTDEETGEDKIIVKQGRYSYMDDSGKPVEFIYDINRPGDVEIDE